MQDGFLPFIPIENRTELPAATGIYLAMDTDGTVFYVGRSVNLQDRWRSHERLEALIVAGCTHIAWQLCEYEDLVSLERTAIEEHRPRFNKSYLGKNRNPDYIQTTVLLETDLHADVKITMLETHYEGDFSDLVNSLVKEWVAEHKIEHPRRDTGDFTDPGPSFLLNTHISTF